jgi:hypothetical protein
MKASTAPERRPSTLSSNEGIKIMNTTTFASSPLGLAQPLNFLRGLLAASTTASESAEELLRLADLYEATQPSYADDLRAAASASFH